MRVLLAAAMRSRREGLIHGFKKKLLSEEFTIGWDN
jgi:hypothetical protein